MYKVKIANLDNKLLFSDLPKISILDIIHSNGVDWMHACGKKGKCTTCKMVVTNGLDNISELTTAEIKYRNVGGLEVNERLACQSFLEGDIEIRVSDKYRFPHMIYTE